MLALLLLVVATQAPPVPGETTLVSFCKQGSLSACEALRQANPAKAAELKRELANAALRLEAMRAADEEARDEDTDEAAEPAEGAAPEPPDCKGQDHHVISRPIAKALKDHKTLKELYEPRDERFVAKAKDEESHCGYQTWHRDLDQEVIAWLKRRENATQKEFEALLRAVYNRSEMRVRFPNGFGPAK